MDIFLFVIIIVLIGSGTGMYNNYIKHQRYVEKSGLKDQDLEDELVRLRERIEVLEKIVTDEGYALKRELDQLESQS